MLSTSRATIAIPARIGSKRIPRKPLIDIAGKPLVVRVAEAALKCEAAQEVVVVTDSHDVADAVQGTCDVIIEDRLTWCGTARIALAWARVPSLFPVRQEPTNIIINWQIDEPFVSPEDVGRLMTLVHWQPHPRKIVTLVCHMPSPLDGFRPSVVSAAVRKTDGLGHGETNRFSRSGACMAGARRHIGIYGFAATALQELATVKQTRRAKTNDLEQLAWVDAGFCLSTTEIDPPRLSVRTMEDVAAANELLGRPKHVRIDVRRTFR